MTDLNAGAELASPAYGAFGWVRRMGIHFAYHQSTANRVIHAFFIPLELFALVLLTSQLKIGGVAFALILLALLAPIYIATEPLIGSLMTALLLAMYALVTNLFPEPSWIAAGIAASIFASSFVVQTQVGHGVCEGGPDDTDCNFAEFFETRNPVPLILVFYYHLVAAVLATGYRPELRRRIAQVRDSEIEALAARSGNCELAGGTRRVIVQS
ncbi:MAG: hypothetical protein ACRDKE_03910 [Solirubrobacterales bacterium]